MSQKSIVDNNFDLTIRELNQLSAFLTNSRYQVRFTTFETHKRLFH